LSNRATPSSRLITFAETPDHHHRNPHLGLYMTANEAGYAESYRDEWRRRGGAVKTAFEKWDIQQVDAGAVADFLHDNWADKLPTYQAMHGWLSKFFGWCIVRRHITTNPCREIEVEKPKARRVYIPHAAFLAIRAALETYSYEKTIGGEKRKLTAKVPTGAMMQIFVDLCYLTCQRSTEIRLLTWGQIDRAAGLIHFIPTKTEDSTGEAVDWPITPEIDAVLQRARKAEPICEYVVRDKQGIRRRTRRAAMLGATQ
jgi:integrase